MLGRGVNYSNGINYSSYRVRNAKLMFNIVQGNAMSIVRREVGVELYRRNTVKALPRPISHNPRPITGGFQRCCQLFRHHIAKNQFLILRINIFCSFYQPWLQIPHEKRVHRAACVHATRNIFMVDSFPARSIANGIPEQDHETRHWLAEAL